MLKSYFTFTKNQSRAIVMLITCILSCIVFYFLMPYIFAQENAVQNEELQNLMAQIHLNENQDHFSPKNVDEVAAQPLTPFHFDPNTIDSISLKKMGLRDKLIHTMLNYRSKGGKFYNKESLQRIYGLHPDEYKQLAPYITISNLKEEPFFKQQKQEVLSIELNTADTAQLVKLNGIGSKLAQNIVKYRAQLGGFVNKEQLKEVYGISAETYSIISPSIKLNPRNVKRINLNEATFQEINAHPYLKGELATALADFRKKKNYHIDNIFQLKEIELLDEKLFRKIAPYIITQ